MITKTTGKIGGQVASTALHHPSVILADNLATNKPLTLRSPKKTQFFKTENVKKNSEKSTFFNIYTHPQNPHIYPIKKHYTQYLRQSVKKNSHDFA